jgi:hypothetical protein
MNNAIALTYGPEIETSNIRGDRLGRAFALVCPKAWGRADWKEEIRAVLSDADLTAMGVTLADVSESVMHYTATALSIRETSTLKGERAYVVTAKGYRRGPAW